MPFVSGWLRMRRRGHPDQGLPGEEGETDPGYGVEEGAPDQGLPPLDPEAPNQGLPRPPPGIWPPPSPSHPIEPVPPGDGTPPGTIWPSPGTPEHPIASQKFWVVAGIPGVGWRYVCVDPSLMPPSAGTKPVPVPTPN